jgi:nicotinamidase-related amidase
MPTIDEILHARQERIDELHRLQAGRTALLVVDMQCGFLEPGAALEVPAGRAILPDLRRLIAACRQRAVPVIFTRFVYATAAPRPEELVVSGHTYDKFVGTPLDLALRSQDIRCLVVTGVVTEVCVNCTLLSAANRDYRVTAVTDGVATLWPELQEACFAIWRRKFARLRTTDEVIDELQEGPLAAGRS